MSDLELLGVRGKVWKDGRVAVILYKRVDEEIKKYYLDNEGAWQLVEEGKEYPKLRTVFHQFDFEFPDLV